MKIPGRSEKSESRATRASVFRQRPEAMTFITKEWPGFRLCFGLMSLEEECSVAQYSSLSGED